MRLSKDMAVFISGLARMHVLYLNGKFDSDEADDLRDEMDAPWERLSDEDKKVTWKLSRLLNQAKDVLTSTEG